MKTQLRSQGSAKRMFGNTLPRRYARMHKLGLYKSVGIKKVYHRRLGGPLQKGRPKSTATSANRLALSCLGYPRNTSSRAAFLVEHGPSQCKPEAASGLQSGRDVSCRKSKSVDTTLRMYSWANQARFFRYSRERHAPMVSSVIKKRRHLLRCCLSACLGVWSSGIFFGVAKMVAGNMARLPPVLDW